MIENWNEPWRNFDDGLKQRLRGRLWEELARPEQLPPPGVWSVWYIQGGRGSGKTRAGGETLAGWIRANEPGDWAIVAPTLGDARNVCVEGPSGLLRPLAGLVHEYLPSLSQIHLKDGGRVFMDSASEGGTRIQGKNLRGAWCDEIGLWPQKVWRRAWLESLVPAVRLDPGRVVATGTPKVGHGLVRYLVERAVVTRMTIFDNIDNLGADAVQAMAEEYAGTSLGRQELYGELITEVEGALWRYADIEAHRLAEAPALGRIVVGVDPPGGRAECGIVTAAVAPKCPCGSGGKHPHYCVLGDDSAQLRAEAWPQRVATTYERFEADAVIGEKNFGGDMVRALLAQAAPNIRVVEARATRGKHIRAEPVRMLYETGRVHHLGVFPQLEEEMTAWVPEDSDWSPNRLDALVWAMTSLMTRSLGSSLAGLTDPALTKSRDWSL